MFPTGLLGWGIAVAPLPLFLLAALFPSQLAIPIPKAEPYLDRAFGNGFYRKVFIELGMALWLGVGSLLHGLVGMARSVSVSAHIGALAMSLFFVSGGIGMLSLFLITRRRLAGSDSGHV